MADTTSARASLLDPGVAVLGDTENISRSAFSCSDLDKLVETDAENEQAEEEDEGTSARQLPTADESNMVTMALMTLLLAGFLAVCGVLVVRLMRADEAAFVRRLEQRLPQVQSKHIQVVVDLDQLYTGDDIQIDVDRTLVCSKCAGTGEDANSGFHSCHKCQGTGVYASVEQVGPFQQRVRSVCNVCQGKGRVANSKCDVCKGRGLRRGSASLSVHVEPGVRHGDELLLVREGDQAPLHIPGHIIVHVTMTQHPALVGFYRNVVHLDGRVVKLHRETVVQPTTVWKIPSEGMPRRNQQGEFGYLLVHFNIAYPAELDAAAKAAVCQLLRD
ncbi:hypothetical protein PRIC1_008653 [Phytophthora ramorum]